MRTRMYGGVRGRKTKVGGKPTFVFLLLDCNIYYSILYHECCYECKDGVKLWKSTIDKCLGEYVMSL